MTGPSAPRPYGALLIGEPERAAVDALLSSGVLYRYQGSAVSSLEERFAVWLGDGTLALAVNSGTSALQLALATCELEPGEEVLVPTFGFVSAATAVHAVGAVPRFVSVDRSLTVDGAIAASMVTDRSRAILAVHPCGTPCDLEAVATLARRFDMRIVEDVAQACGGTFRGRRLGTFGHTAAFSFQHFKLIATGEGGMMVTRDPDAHDRASFLHDSAALWTMPERAARVAVVAGAPGNMRMSEIEGTIGLIQLERCDEVVAHLRGLKRRAVELFTGGGRCTPAPSADAAGDVGTHLVAYLADADDAADAVSALRGRGIAAARILGDPGSNRHWAGDWHGVLERCGIALPDPDVIDHDQRTLATGVVVQLDATLSDERAESWLEQLGCVLG